MRANKNFVLRNVGGRSVAVPIGEECKRFNGVIKLNETAKWIFESVESGLMEDEAVAAMTEQYEVSLEHARESYRNTVEKMLAAGLLRDE